MKTSTARAAGCIAAIFAGCYVGLMVACSIVEGRVILWP